MRSTLLGILVNLGLSATKISAGAADHSFALVADGLESGADFLSGLVVFFGLKIAIKPPDRDHPYGHGKAEPIAALCVGLSLVGAAVTIMVESIHEILTPHRLPAPYTLVVLAGVLIVKGLLFRHVGSVGDSIGSLAVKGDAAHHCSDAITSAFAFVGISIAVLGGPGWEAADDWAALCAGVSFCTTRGTNCDRRSSNLPTSPPTLALLQGSGRPPRACRASWDSTNAS